MTQGEIRDRTETEIADSIKELLDRVKTLQVDTFDAIEKKPGAKLNRMVALWKSMLAFRLADIADASLNLIEEDRLVCGNILTRSALETAAAIHVLGKRTSAAKDHSDYDELLQFLQRALFGSRDESSEHDALNVLTMIDHLDKEISVARDQYDHLSEYAHPNLKGGLMAYSSIDIPELTAKLGINPDKLPPITFGLGDLEIVLVVGLEQLERLERIAEEFTETVWEKAPQIFTD